ncbi:MAG: ABC transporter ATP-binding protein [Desulfobacteraceae bacterium]|jgi:oligopeptide/dipeptide ABC transporter ATP-binding protein|nr:ABC transporter ATP-binding protein [Desulfobacteraceae bacterium]
MAMPHLLSVKNLSVHFSTGTGIVKAVDRISYNLNAGETLGIVGESGCGKTVSALSLLRLIPNPPGKIVGGEIFFEGKDLLKAGKEEICNIRGNKIAMIFQEPMTSLNPVLTIGHQIGEPLVTHQKMKKKQAAIKAANALTEVNIPDSSNRINDYPHQFSGGMCQRAMIAMGLTCSPKIIIADEPTTALDVTIQAELLMLMKKSTMETGAALIIITHNLGIIARYADRVHVMYAGKIVEKATAADLYKNPKHPYTKGLMASVPRLDQDVKARLQPVEGQPPDMADMPEGCSFHPRCRYRIGKCLEQEPFLRTIADGHEIGCWVDV